MTHCPSSSAAVITRTERNKHWLRTEMINADAHWMVVPTNRIVDGKVQMSQKFCPLRIQSDGRLRVRLVNA